MIIKKYQDFKSGLTKSKPEEEEKPTQKTDNDSRQQSDDDDLVPYHKTDKFQKPAKAISVPGWETY